MICTLEVLDTSGHVTLQWDPDNDASVRRAEAEFKKMQNAGFVFFTDAGPEYRVSQLDDVRRAGHVNAALEEQPLEQVRTFRRRARRTVAVAPMRGG